MLRLLPGAGVGEGGNKEWGGRWGRGRGNKSDRGCLLHLPHSSTRGEHVPGQGTPELGLGRLFRHATLSSRPLLFLLIRLREIKHTSRSKGGEGERKREAKRAQTKKLTAQVSLDVGQNYNEIEETRRAELRREMGVQGGLPAVASCPPPSNRPTADVFATRLLSCPKLARARVLGDNTGSALEVTQAVS